MSRPGTDALSHARLAQERVLQNAVAQQKPTSWFPAVLLPWSLWHVVMLHQCKQRRRQKSCTPRLKFSHRHIMLTFLFLFNQQCQTVFPRLLSLAEVKSSSIFGYNFQTGNLLWKKCNMPLKMLSVNCSLWLSLATSVLSKQPLLNEEK